MLCQRWAIPLVSQFYLRMTLLFFISRLFRVFLRGKIVQFTSLCFAGPDDVCVRVHSRIPVVVRDGKTGAGTNQVRHRHPQHRSQPTSLASQGPETVQNVRIPTQDTVEISGSGENEHLFNTRKPWFYRTVVTR